MLARKDAKLCRSNFRKVAGISVHPAPNRHNEALDTIGVPEICEARLTWVGERVEELECVVKEICPEYIVRLEMVAIEAG